MSLHGDLGNSCHLTISAPGATSVGVGDYTVAALFKPNDFTVGTVWKGYQANDFSFRGLYFDGDMWIPNEQADTNIPNPTTPPVNWYWFVVTRELADGAPRAHYAIYSSSGGLTWVHMDASSTQIQKSNINRFCLSDEFGPEFRGNIAVLTAFTHEMSDADIETTFLRSSSSILAQTPGFFVHWPLADGMGSPFSDLAGGGVETIRTGTWDMTADPDGFDFSLSVSRTGKSKIWNGADWVAHPAKVWDGSSWTAHSMKGFDGTDWIESR